MTLRNCLAIMLIAFGLSGCINQGVQDKQLPLDQILDTEPLHDTDYPAYKTMVWGFYWPDMPGWTRESPKDAFSKLILTQDKYRLSVTQFSGQAGSLLANINRWRRQLGLAPVTRVPNTVMQSDNYQMVRLNNTETAFIIAVQSVHGKDWFIKLSGPQNNQDTMSVIMTKFLADLQLDPHDHTHDHS